MELTNWNYKHVKEDKQNKARERYKSSGGPGAPIQDYETRKQLRMSKKKVDRNTKWVYISFVIEFIVFIVVLTSWVMLSQM